MTSTEADPDEPDVQLRRATPDDAAALAEVHLAARKGAGEAMPPSVHPDEDALPWVAGWLAENEVWVAEAAGTPVGYASLTATWLDGLFVAREHAGQGIGGMLLDVAKAVRPDGFALWVFESNLPARRFYTRRGLVELELTDGSGNEEHAPDIRMAWPGRDPLRYLRGQVDEVDDDLARLLARRAALTAAIQDVKETPGHAGRDPGREAEIARRMARHAPTLGEAGLQRIVREIITASLDAHARSATLAAYQADADRYAAAARPLTAEMLALVDAFVASLPPGAAVLEIGSGSGRDARALEERGARVRRTDLTPAFVDRLRREGYDAVRLDPLVDDLGGPYDGVYASAVLLHLTRDDCEVVLRRLRAATREGGVLAVTLKEGDGSGWSTHGEVSAARHFTYWRAEALRAVLAATGWTVARLDAVHAGRVTDQPWLHVLATAGGESVGGTWHGSLT